MNQSSAVFLETMFDFITIPSDMDDFSISGAQLEEVQMGESGEVAKFDFSITFVYNPASNDNRLFCYLSVLKMFMRKELSNKWPRDFNVFRNKFLEEN